MSFDVTCTDQYAKMETAFRINMYATVNTWSKKTQWTRLTGVFVGVISALSNIIRRIACIVESFLKAIANIFGSLIKCENCKFLTGVKQIGYTIGHVVYLPFTIFKVIFPLVCSTVGIAIVPGRYTQKCQRYYDVTFKMIEETRKKNLALFSEDLDEGSKSETTSPKEYMDEESPNDKTTCFFVNYVLT